ncbi:DUF748 domain-containing protein [Pontibacterium sp.]|uniref:DUF748 domain-containing protein n=1 Tax=Pontibacterium sp. TaxID=2036026 RepID=UPI003565B7A1
MRWLLTLLVIVALFLHNLPYLIRDQAVIWLRSQGVETASLKALNVNWLSGEIEILELRAESDGHQSLNIDRLFVKLDYAALTDQRILVRTIQLKGLNSGIVEQAPSLWLGPIDLNALSGDDSTQETSDSGSAWLPGIDDIQLEDIRWYTAMAGQEHQLNISQGELKDFHFWNKEQPTALNLDGSINGAPLSLKTESTPLPEEKRSTLRVNISQFPLHSVTALIEPGLKAFIDLDLKISADFKGETGQVTQSGSIRVSDLKLARDGLDVQQSDLNWKGDVAVSLRDGQPDNLSVKGLLTGNKLDLKQPETELQLAGYTLSLNTQLQGKQQSLSQKGPLSLTGLQASLGDQSLQQSKLDWDGEVALVLNQGQPTDLRVGGDLNGQGLVLQQQKQQVKLGQYALNAQVKSADMAAFDIQLPSTELQQFSLSAAANPLLALQNLVVKQAQVKLPLQVKTGPVSADGLLVLGENKHLLKLARTRLKSVHFLPEHAAALGSLSMAGLDANVTLSPEGKMSDVDWLLAQLSPPSDDKVVADKSTSEPAKPLRISLKSFDMVGKNQIHFTDQGTEPAFSSTVDLETLTLGAVDTGTVQSTPFGLQATINQFSTLDLKGEAELSGDEHNANWQLNLKDLELPPLSPYAERFTGYYLNSGQFNLDAKGTLAEGKIEGVNQMRLNRLTVDQRDSDKVAAFSQKITMPLETAIMILEDNDNNIELDIPVSGSLSDPEFGYQSVINELAGRGLKTAAISFLTKSLQPYATLISLASTAMEASEKGTFITLTPVAFTPGSAALNGKGKEYLGKLSDMLKERQAMRLNICGRAVAADGPELMPALVAANKKRKKPLSQDALQQELQQKLLDLANQRAATVKQHMSASIDNSRLFLCFAKVEQTADANARVELGL